MADATLYEATEAQLLLIERALHDGAGVKCYAKAQAAVDEIRMAVVPDTVSFKEFALDEATKPLHAEIERLGMHVSTVMQQRDHLDRVAGSAIERMAGEIVARGFMTLQVAAAWANKERADAAAGLAAIEQAASAQHGPEEVALP